MLKYPPIYTEETKCQDCYKCLRSCPVKAIKVEDKCATILRDNCIACGYCVEVCPSGAKKVRSDLRFARNTLEQRSRVIASLAPSFVNEFPEIQPAQLIAAIRALGFFGVSETALGAQQVSAHAAAALRDSKQKVMLSSACPTAVEFIRKYHPDTPIKSPTLCLRCSPIPRCCGALMGRTSESSRSDPALPPSTKPTSVRIWSMWR